jgi:hypothetical protein
MCGPAMIAGGGLGEVAPDELRPVAMQAPNGVVDVVAVTRNLLGHFAGPRPPGLAGASSR